MFHRVYQVAVLILGVSGDPAAVERLQEICDLNRPFLQPFADHVIGLFQGE